MAEANRRRVHKFKIILSNTPDSDSQGGKRSRQHLFQKIYAKATRSLRASLFVIEFIPALVLFVIPFSVHAGLVSKVMDIFNSEEDAATIVDATNTSALNTPLLSALKNPDPLKAQGGGDVHYQDGALIATGPVGTDQKSTSQGKGDISVYTVRDGDSLSQIAAMYGVTVNTIIWANDLKDASDIHAGDVLVILPFVGIRHTVEKGESLESIVKKYGADLAEVMKYNDLESAESITVGQELMLPGGELVAPTKASKKTPTTAKQTASKSAKGSWLINPAPGSVETQGIHGHNGVDLASYGGKHIPIVAAAAGKVIVSKSSGWNGGYGQYIVIQHNNGEQTLYAHLSKNIAGVGDWVTQGEQIGVMGETGEATGVHVHFEVHGGVNPF